MSAAIAAWVAHTAFWVLLVWGMVTTNLTVRGLVTFVVVWLIGWFGLPLVPYEPAHAMFGSFVAVLDVVLVFVVFKGDVQIG
jgi:hypothetical protein